MQNIGALWGKTAKSGNKFLSGMIEVDGKKVRVTVWKNSHKKEDKHPDYQVYLDTWEPNGGETKPKNEGKPKSAPKPQVDDDDDIPF